MLVELNTRKPISQTELSDFIFHLSKGFALIFNLIVLWE